jgi:hypothetical protein
MEMKCYPLIFSALLILCLYGSPLAGKTNRQKNNTKQNPNASLEMETPVLNGSDGFMQIQAPGKKRQRGKIDFQQMKSRLDNDSRKIRRVVRDFESKNINGPASQKSREMLDVAEKLDILAQRLRICEISQRECEETADDIDGFYLEYQIQTLIDEYTSLSQKVNQIRQKGTEIHEEIITNLKD